MTPDRLLDLRLLTGHGPFDLPRSVQADGEEVGLSSAILIVRGDVPRGVLAEPLA